MSATIVKGAAPAAPTFDPAEWLAAFEAVGGWHIANPGELTLGWYVYGHPDEHQDAARALYRRVEGDGPDRDALHALLIDRKAEAMGLTRIVADFIATGGRLIMQDGKVETAGNLAWIFGGEKEARTFQIWADMEHAVRDFHDTLARTVSAHGRADSGNWLVLDQKAVRHGE